MDYLIPAGSKKQLLIFGAFKPIELAFFAIALGTTILLLMILNPSSFVFAMIDMAPALITGFLLLPIPHYHNTLTVLKEMYVFFTTRQKFIWKGWCVRDAYKEK